MTQPDDLQPQLPDADEPVSFGSLLHPEGKNRPEALPHMEVVPTPDEDLMVLPSLSVPERQAALPACRADMVISATRRRSNQASLNSLGS